MDARNDIVMEVIRHECEKHDLMYLGLISDFDSLLKQVREQTGFSPDFSKTKEQALSVFYGLIDFKSLARQYKKAVNRLDSSVRQHLKRVLYGMEQQSPDISPDKELKVRKTIAYHLSGMIFDRFYNSFRCSDSVFDNPKELKQFFGNLVKETYPLSFQSFMSQLVNRDDEFWDRVGDLLLKLSQHVTIPNISSSVYRDITGGEIVSESYLVIKQAVDEEKVHFNDALHFRKFSYNVCKNKCHEYMRKSRNHRTDSLEDLFLPLEDESILDSISGKDEEMMYDVNPGNPYELAKMLSLVLYHKEHPLHQTMVDGEEERVGLLMDIAIEGLSYDQLIEKRYNGKQLPESERKKLNARLRQDYVRIKKKLINRLEKILEQNG